MRKIHLLFGGGKEPREVEVFLLIVGDICASSENKKVWWISEKQRGEAETSWKLGFLV